MSSKNLNKKSPPLLSMKTHKMIFCGSIDLSSILKCNFGVMLKQIVQVCNLFGLVWFGLVWFGLVCI